MPREIDSSQSIAHLEHVLVVADMETLAARGRQRWVDHACTEEMIRAKLDDDDMPNVRLVYERGAEPDWIIRT